MASGLIGDMADSISAAGWPLLKRAAGIVTRRLPIPTPVLLTGAGSSARLGDAIARFGHKRLLVVTDTGVARLGLAAPLLEALTARAVDHVVFDAVLPDAPIPVVEEGVGLFQAEACDGIVAVGGGSVMDTAKVIGLAAANRKHPADLAGYFRGLRGPVPIYAVPTTAGTGSEVTVAAVIEDPDTRRKMVVADTRLVPAMAALDPALMTGLPPALTAATGMDALTHAIEAFLSGWATPHTDRMALAATAMIWQHLPRACEVGADLEAREQMALASTYAGLAFTRANVGNVHALAHQVGGRYGVPHGLANAILLPGVLRFALPAVRERLVRLARHLGVEGEDGTLAERFVDAVQALADRIAIPRTLAPLRADDIAELALAACHEADHNYPVPRRMEPADAEALLRAVLPANATAAAAATAATPGDPGTAARARRSAAASSKRAPLRRPVRTARHRQRGN